MTLDWSLLVALPLDDDELSSLLHAVTTKARQSIAAAMRSRRWLRFMCGSFLGERRAVLGSDTSSTVLLRRLGVEGVLQAVADDVEGEDGDEQEHSGEQHEPPGIF